MQQSDQPEDRMDNQAVQIGYTDKAQFHNEHITGFDALHERLSRPQSIAALTALASDILAAQAEARVPRKSAYVLPQRIVSSDKARENWINEVIKGDTPVTDLARNVPHGIRTERLLEMITAQGLPLPRALWAIKVIGLNELIGTGQVSKATKPDLHLQQCFKFTDMMSEFLEKQLGEIAPTVTPPPAAAPALSSLALSRGNKRLQNKDSLAPPPKKALTPEQRQQFIVRWEYLVRLCAKLYGEGLLDQRKFLKQTVDLYTKATFTQMFFVVPLVSAFMSEFGRSRALMRSLLLSSVLKLKRLKSTLATAGTEMAVQDQYSRIIRLLQDEFACAPDAFVGVKVWSKMEEFSREIFAGKDKARLDIERRNKWLLSTGQRSLPFAATADKILSGIGPTTDFSKLYDEWDLFFDGFADISCALEVLFTWALSNPCPTEDYRLYVATKLISEWYDDLESDDPHQQRKNLQRFMFSLLDRLIANGPQDPDSLFRLHLLFSELERFRLFSAQLYMQRLVARGDLESDGPLCAKYSRFLRGFAAPSLSGDAGEATGVDELRDVLVSVTRLDTAQQAAETSQFESVKSRVLQKLAAVFSAGDQVDTTRDKPVHDTYHDLHLALADPTFVEQLKQLGPLWRLRLSLWLYSKVTAYIVRVQEIGIDNWKTVSVPGSSVLNDRQLAVILSILEVLRDYQWLLETVLWTLSKATERSMYRSIVYALKRHQTVFHSMGCSRLIFNALLDKHNALRKRGTSYIDFHILGHLKDLLALGVCDVSPEDQAVILIDPSSFLKRGASKDAHTVTEFRDVRDFKDERQGVSVTVSSLLWRYQGNREPLHRLFKYTTSLLQRQSTAFSNRNEFLRRIAIAVEILREVADRNEFLPAMVADHFRDVYALAKPNFSSTPAAGLELLLSVEGGPQTWNLSFIVQLCASRACSVQKILEDVAEPVFIKARGSLALLRSTPFANLMTNLVVLLRVLLVSSETVDPHPELFMTVQQYQYLSTLRATVLRSKPCISAVLRILQHLSVVRARLTPRPTISSNTTSSRNAVASPHSAPLVTGIAVLMTHLVESPSWFKRACIQDCVWAGFDLARVYSDAKKSSVSPEDSPTDIAIHAAHVMVKVLWNDAFEPSCLDTAIAPRHLALQPSDPQAPAIAAQLVQAPFAMDEFDVFFGRVLRLAGPRNVDRTEFLLSLTLDLLHFHQSVHSTASAGHPGDVAQGYSRCWNRLADVLFQELFAGRPVDFTRLLPKVRWDFFKRLVGQVHAHLENAQAVLGVAVGSAGGQPLLASLSASSLSFSGVQGGSPPSLASFGSQPGPATVVSASAMLAGAGRPSPAALLVSDATVIRLFGDFAVQLVLSLIARLQDARKTKTAKNAKQEEAYLADLAGFVAAIHRDLAWMLEHARVIDLMAVHDISFGQVQTLFPEQCAGIRGGGPTAEQDQVRFTHLQHALLMRLKLIKTLAPVLLENPAQGHVLSLLQTLTRLLATKLVAHECQALRVFEVALDVTSWLMDDIPKDQNKELIKWLWNCRADFVMSPPAGPRISRILPFQDHHPLFSDLVMVPNNSAAGAASVPDYGLQVASALTGSAMGMSYMSGSALVSTPGSIGATPGPPSVPTTPAPMPASSVFGEAGKSGAGGGGLPRVYQQMFLPWLWIEDPGDAGTQYTESTAVDGGVGGKAWHTGGMAWLTGGAVGALNNTPISLSLVGAVVMRPSGSAYVQMSRSGWTRGEPTGGGDVGDGDDEDGDADSCDDGTSDSESDVDVDVDVEGGTVLPAADLTLEAGHDALHPVDLDASGGAGSIKAGLDDMAVDTAAEPATKTVKRPASADGAKALASVESRPKSSTSVRASGSSGGSGSGGGKTTVASETKKPGGANGVGVGGGSISVGSGAAASATTARAPAKRASNGTVTTDGDASASASASTAKPAAKTSAKRKAPTASTTTAAAAGTGAAAAGSGVASGSGETAGEIARAKAAKRRKSGHA
ncbi:hypothetical protein BC831DRAFT_206471 [Entophlyctis helioformis]|nr:hypothetical protein BC831DRAFT_206471 [Entophlyctis helioformis]